MGKVGRSVDSILESVYLNTTLVLKYWQHWLVFQLEVYYKIDRLLTGLPNQQRWTTAQWYSNKTPLSMIWSLKINFICPVLWWLEWKIWWWPRGGWKLQWIRQSGWSLHKTGPQSWGLDSRSRCWHRSFGGRNWETWLHQHWRTWFQSWYAGKSSFTGKDSILAKNHFITINLYTK